VADDKQITVLVGLDLSAASDNCDPRHTVWTSADWVRRDRNGTILAEVLPQW